MLHFLDELKPNFDSLTAQVVGANSSSQAALAAALNTLRGQHEGLVEFGIMHGFDLSYENGYLTFMGRDFAKWSVPFSARCFRETAIFAAVSKLKSGEQLYKQLTSASDADTRSDARCKSMMALADAFS
jgi:hypothetical protein